MEFWLSVYLPLLPLEALRPRWSEPGHYAVLEDGRVISLSTSARAEGVTLGMRGSGVSTIAPEVVQLDRSPVKEEIAKQSVAMALLAFTPEVVANTYGSFLLHVSASLRLFKGHLNLCRQIRGAVERQGLSVQIGAAPTALGAWLLSRDPKQKMSPRRRTIKLATLGRRLDQLHACLLPSTAPYAEWLEGIGACSLGALRQLPRAGLKRRTSPELLLELDRAYGTASELFEWIQVPPTFSARMETFDRIEHAEALMTGATALIEQMVGWLTVQHLAISVFVLHLEHERGREAVPPTEIEVTLAEPAWRSEHLLRLLKERLGRIELVAYVIAVRLEAKLFAPMAPPTGELFKEISLNKGRGEQLTELLTARLGKDNVLVPAPIADHRPEVANHWAPITEKRLPADEDEMPDGMVRPFWVLPTPIALLVRNHRPFYGSPLKLIHGPDRIEAGWWDDGLEARDYYVAQGDDSCCYWIYLERSQDARWYLHGLFA